mgnify:CR=1 FL=1
MSKLSFEGKEEFRAFVEEELNKVPEGKKMKLSKETLEKLLFEEIVVNEEKNITVKFPIWSGKFLRKLDLSEIDFENVSWHALHFFKKFKCTDKDIFTDIFFGLHDDDFEKRIEELLKLKRLYNKEVDYSGTNVSIDLSKSFERRFFGDWVSGCNFSGCNVYFSKDILGLELYESDFSDSSLKLIGNFDKENLLECNFENCDLSECENNILFSIISNQMCNFRNTKANLVFDKSLLDEKNKTLEYDTKKLVNEFFENDMDKYIVGAYLNGDLILPLEERKKQEELKKKEQEKAKKELQRLKEEESRQELQRLKDEVSALFSEQQEEEKTKHV